MFLTFTKINENQFRDQFSIKYVFKEVLADIPEWVFCVIWTVVFNI